MPPQFFVERMSFSIQALAAWEPSERELNVFMVLYWRSKVRETLWSLSYWIFFHEKLSLKMRRYSGTLPAPVIVNHGARPVCLLCAFFFFFLWRVLKASLTDLLQHVPTPKSSSTAAWSVALHFKLGSSLHGRKGRAGGDSLRRGGKAGGAAAAHGAGRWRRRWAHRGVWLEAEVEEAGVAVQPELEGNNNATLKQMHQQTQIKDKDRKCKVKTCLMRRIYKIKQEIQNEKTKPGEQVTSLTNLNQKTSMFSPLNTNISYFLLVRIKHLAGVASPMRNPIHLFLPAVSD